MKRLMTQTLASWLVLLTLLLSPTPTQAATLTVTNTNDSGSGSLRAQIAAASAGDTIDFNASLSGPTITLTSGEMIIDKNLTIDGSSLASAVTISGNNNGRIFDVTDATVSLTRLRLINGDSNTGDPGNNDGDGGAIYVRDNANLTVTESEFANNQSEFNGGAIYNFNATLTLTNNTFTDNSTQYSGGALRTFASQTVLITGNTFVSNTAAEGGAVWTSGGAETMINNTFANNSDYGTVYLYEPLTLTNNTFLGNNGVFIRNVNAVLHMRNNIIGRCNNVGGAIGTNINNWIVNNSCSPTYNGNPYLMPLADNGGSTQTAALMPFSGAINGANSSCPTTDQRGQARSSTCDLGAYETQTADHQTIQCHSGLVQGETYPFGATGILMTVDTLGSLTQLCAQLTQSDHPNATAGLQTNRHWILTRTAGADDWSLTLSAPVDFNLDSNDKLCRYTGVGTTWDCDQTSIDNSNNRISRNGVTQLSPWAVGNNVDPTAVQLTDAISIPATQPIFVILIAFALTIITLGVLRKRGC